MVKVADIGNPVAIANVAAIATGAIDAGQVRGGARSNAIFAVNRL